MDEMPEQEALWFYNRGKEIVTLLAQAVAQLQQYSGTFEARGGSLAMGDKYGPPTEEIVILHNDLIAFLEQQGRKELIAKERTDY